MNPSIECGCGSTLKTSSVQNHLKTKKHLQWFRGNVSADCDICYEKKSNFFTCNTCHKPHCTDCNVKMEKCPFCITVIITPEKVKNFKQYLGGHMIQVSIAISSDDKILEVYRMCRYLVKNKDIVRIIPETDRTIIRLKLVEFHEQGFESGLLFIELLELK